MTTPPESTSLRKALAPILGILALIIMAWAGLSIVKSRLGGTESAGAAKVGSTVQDFTLTKWNQGSPERSEVRFSQLGAKVVLINFWATWCEACIVEMPSIIKLREAYKSRGFEVVAINVDDEPDAVLPKTVQKLGINFPVFLDKEGKIADLFDVHAIPLTVILNQERKVLHVETGERDWNDESIHADLEEWLSESGYPR